MLLCGRQPERFQSAFNVRTQKNHPWRWLICLMKGNKNAKICALVFFNQMYWFPVHHIVSISPFILVSINYPQVKRKKRCYASRMKAPTECYYFEKCRTHIYKTHKRRVICSRCERELFIEMRILSDQSRYLRSIGSYYERKLLGLIYRYNRKVRNYWRKQLEQTIWNHFYFSPPC